MAIMDIITGIITIATLGFGCAISSLVLGSIALSRIKGFDRKRSFDAKIEEDERTHRLACIGCVLAFIAIVMAIVTVVLIVVLWL